MNRAIALLTPLALFAPGAALAHPGHGATTDPVLHLLVEPAHALPLLAVAAVGLGIAFVRHARRVKSR